MKLKTKMLIILPYVFFAFALLLIILDQSMLNGILSLIIFLLIRMEIGVKRRVEPDILLSYSRIIRGKYEYWL